MDSLGPIAYPPQISPSYNPGVEVRKIIPMLSQRTNILLASKWRWKEEETTRET
jgi:hypothetical protein